MKLLRRDIWSGGLRLDELKGFEDDFLLGRGDRVAGSYPKKGATYTVKTGSVTLSGPERPGPAGKTKASDLLTDLLNGGDPQIMVVSARMKSLIEAAEKHVEFLPVTIKGHKEPYFIMNCLEHVACLDAKKSEAILVNGEVQRMKRLVLREGAVPAGRALFQVKEHHDLFIVDDSLAASFERAGLTGLQILDLAQYDPS
jgi:hypothetical protein